MFKTLNRKDTNSSKWNAAKKETSLENYLAFSVADSDYETCPHIKDALSKRIEHGAFGYTEVGDDYYEILSNWMERRYHVAVKRSWMLPGTKILTALSVIIQTFTNVQDEVVIQTPVYNMFAFVINQNKRKILANPLVNKNGGYTINFNHLEKCFKRGIKLFILCNPHNPVGRVWTKEEIKHIVALCKTYNVLLVSDEIHADLIMEGHRFTSLLSLASDYDNMIIVNAPGKTFNLAGLQISNYFIPNTKVRSTLKKALIQSFLTTPNLLAVQALKTAYTKCDDWVNAQNKHIFNNYTILNRFIKHTFPQLTLSPLEGTYLAWLDASSLNISSQALYEALAKEGIILSKGNDYGEQCDGFLRMNLACSEAQLLDGLNRLKKALSSLQ